MNRKLILVLIAAMVALMPISTALAQGRQPPKAWTNSTVVVLPGAGIVDPSLNPGVDGYKVFNPGAISVLTVEGRQNEPNSPLSVSSDVRTVRTDAFHYNCGQTYYCGGGDHDSESTLLEDQIWVDGCVKRYGASTWADCNDDHTTGFIAHTDTSMSGGFAWVFTAKSWHHFHESGYVDWNPTTSDNS